MTDVLITEKVRDSETGTQGEQQVKIEAELGGCLCKSGSTRIVGNPWKLGRERKPSSLEPLEGAWLP